MRPVLLHLGPILIRSYPALINTGLLVGAAVAYLEARRRGLDLMHLVDAALTAAVGGLILARAAYVGVHWDYYSNHLRQALRLRDGGLAWQGALVGAVVGAVVLCILRSRRLLVTLDVLTCVAAPLAISAWLGCFVVGCAQGIATFPGQGLLWTLSLDLPDLYGIREPRVAVQLLGAVWSALVLGVTLVAQRRAQRSGMAFALWLTLHSFGSFGLGFLRGDQMALIAGWRVDQVANLALGMAGIGALVLGDPVAGGGSDTTCFGSKTEAMR
jgi:phosphatidylglycerol:prolipoprotein diacylglycerol transferase